ncbi:dormancy-associated protein-like protein 3-like isoform X2 [Cucumis melo var. makuwa]|uniref:Dormancy-associated protein-like protein 3-like isoform X2 n=1 Tax=Cucumis melo var. makuwa TaxID=1194695 RepID=A0A5D3CGD5_CUCMM|nr:dormancy-associated protein-like protein 3-like isoform X2 [Cucumis melo var. makuwa]
MGLLDQLWDDTLAGPTPDSGLGKLRKHPSFTSRSAAAKGMPQRTIKSNNGKRYEEGIMLSSSSSAAAAAEDGVKVSRRIMIVKPPGGYQYGSSPPVSPAASSTPPSSPFSGRESFRFRRRSTSDAYGKTTSEVGARTPTSPFDM